MSMLERVKQMLNEAEVELTENKTQLSLTRQALARHEADGRYKDDNDLLCEEHESIGYWRGKIYVLESITTELRDLVSDMEYNNRSSK